MEKQLLATVVVFLFCVLYTAAIAAQNKGAADDANRSADVNATLAEPETRTQIQNLGFGTRIKVKLKKRIESERSRHRIRSRSICRHKCERRGDAGCLHGRFAHHETERKARHI
jgi:hypothetical protein